MVLRKHILQCAVWIEEASRQKETVTGCIAHALLYSSLLDRYCSSFRLFKSIAYSPAMVLLALVLIYVVFIVVWFPLYLISFVLSTPGSVALLLALIVLSVRSFARTIMFPGSTKHLQKQYAVDYLRRLTAQLESTSTLTTNFTASLMLVSSGRLGRPPNTPVLEKFNSIVHAVDALSEVASWISRATKEVVEAKEGTAGELEPMMALRLSIEKLVSAVGELKFAAMDVLTNGPASSFSHGNAQSSTLLVLCKRLLQASDALKSTSSAIAPRREDGNNRSITQKIGDLLSCNEGPVGAERLSFPLMREQIRSHLGGETMVVRGGECNTIDCMYIPRAHVQQQTHIPQADGAARKPARSDRPCEVSSVGTVLFCGGNASLYETISQLPKENSWVGLYRRLGFDVCFFNYRGFNRSSGAPSPDRVRHDGMCVARHLREHKKVTTLIIHGESIGGLVASYIASTLPVDLLICDRTFASLDAVAGRLMGQWAFLGLRYIGLYRSDVVSDYMRANCPKIILQDPSDEIIINSASLKVCRAHVNFSMPVKSPLYRNDKSQPNHNQIITYCSSHLGLAPERRGHEPAAGRYDVGHQGATANVCRGRPDQPAGAEAHAGRLQQRAEPRVSPALGNLQQPAPPTQSRRAHREVHCALLRLRQKHCSPRREHSPGA